MKRSVVVSILCCVAFAGAIAQATPITPSQTVVLFAPEPDPVGGTPIATMTLPFSSPTFTGTLTSTVISGDTSNTLGGLTFVYELVNSDTSPDALHRLTVNGFNGFLTDASYQAAQTQKPTTVDRSVNGDVIGFGFIGAPLGFGALMPGQMSTPLVVQTNAPDFQRTYASVIDGNVTNVGTFSPKVPEPTTGLLLLGMTFALIRRR